MRPPNLQVTGLLVVVRSRGRFRLNCGSALCVVIWKTSQSAVKAYLKEKYGVHDQTAKGYCRRKRRSQQTTINAGQHDCLDTAVLPGSGDLLQAWAGSIEAMMNDDQTYKLSQSITITPIGAWKTGSSAFVGPDHILTQVIDRTVEKDYRICAKAPISGKVELTYAVFAS